MKLAVPCRLCEADKYEKNSYDICHWCDEMRCVLCGGKVPLGGTEEEPEDAYYETAAACLECGEPHPHHKSE